jgi:hypothetical protein
VHEAETETVPLGELRAEALLDDERLGVRLTVTDTVGVLLLATERDDLAEPVEEIVPEGLAETEAESEEVLLVDTDLVAVGEAVGVRLAELDNEPDVETVGEAELRGEAETLGLCAPETDAEADEEVEGVLEGERVAVTVSVALGELAPELETLADAEGEGLPVEEGEPEGEPVPEGVERGVADERVDTVPDGLRELEALTLADALADRDVLRESVGDNDDDATMLAVGERLAVTDTDANRDTDTD